MWIFSLFPKKIEMFLLLIYELQADIIGKRKIEMNCGQESRQQTDKSKMEQLMRNIGMCVDAGVDVGPGDTFINLDGEGAKVYGEWDEERRASFISSILGGGDKKKDEKVIECCMCGDKVKDRKSHNARPVYDGRCCWDCNQLVYLARRTSQEEGGRDLYAEVHLMNESFPSTRKWGWNVLKNHIKSFKERAGARVMAFCPIEVIQKANKDRMRAEEKEKKDREERKERYWKMIEEQERLAKIEEERKVRDAEETKKREEDFELRLKALEVKEAQRKEEEKREKEEKAKKAESKRQETLAKQEAKQARWKKQ
jgi:hypothetical protein